MLLASGKDINIMVFDTEVYSNTGGQSSKATPDRCCCTVRCRLVKNVKKKDLACYRNELWLCICCTDLLWVLITTRLYKAIAEAEAYPGPSLIIAYAPCINHGIKKGMSKAQTEEELAVKCGYWHNFRFNPAAENKFSLDSKTPDMENYHGLPER